MRNGLSSSGRKIKIYYAKSTVPICAWANGCILCVNAWQVVDTRYIGFLSLPGWQIACIGSAKCGHFVG